MLGLAEFHSVRRSLLSISRLRSTFTRSNAFELLELKQFTKPEISASFEKLKGSQTDEKIDINASLKLLLSQKDAKDVDSNVSTVKKYLFGTKQIDKINFEDYEKEVLKAGEKLDQRVWNIGASFLFTGTSVGVIVPCMPLLVAQLDIPSYQFGMVIAAFGLSRLIGNIPSGYFVEKYGRKHMLVTGLGMCALGLGSVGLTLLPNFGTPWLLACRFFSGLGVSAFMAGGYMYISDISTPLNRTRTIAPVMAGFSETFRCLLFTIIYCVGGAALGPALGGVLIDHVGISYSYLAVGGLFGALSLMNYLFLTETHSKTLETSTSNNSSSTIHSSNSSSSSNSGRGRVHTVKSIDDDETAESKPTTQEIAPAQLENQERQPHPLPPTPRMLDSFNVAFTAWKRLIRSPDVRRTSTLFGLYWFAYSGTSMTILPLFMVSPAIHLSTSEIGGVFAFMSMVSFLSSQPTAYLADRYGKIPSQLAGCALIAASMAAVPHATTLYELLAATAPMALGATTMNVTPQALIGDLTAPADRAQALSLLRTAGDIGLLVGAGLTGLLSHYTSLEVAFHMNCSVLAVSMMWYGVESYKGLFPWNNRVAAVIKKGEKPPKI